jgi:predicted Zn-dependent protease
MPVMAPSSKKNRSPATNGRSAIPPPKIQRRLHGPRRAGPGLWAAVAAAILVAVGVRLWESPAGRAFRYRRQSIAALQAVAERRPSDPVLLRMLGQKLLAAGRPTEAVEEFRQASVLQGNPAAALVDLGKALAAAGEARDAFATLQLSVAKLPTAEAFAAQARLLLDDGRPEKAIPLLEKAIPLTRASDPEPWRLLALARAAAGQWAAADRAWAHVGSRMPGDVESLLGRAQALVQLGRPEEAEPHVRAALVRQPRSAAAYAALGATLAARQPAAEHAAPAEAAFREALRLQPENQDAAYGLTLLLIREGRGREAAPLAADLMRRAPDSLRARFQYARALRAAGRTAEADRALRDYHRRAEAARLEMELRGRLTVRPDDATLKARLNRLLSENEPGSRR